ncbi:hypothetical protein AZF37_09620 [endosymbiont 'TC1' of Trimyema compressum]|uniref:alanine racemase n=1 Tax=endosymbiont 'TC1' of Trimyema compressum TaxID=243899 RepID=UPI0007F0F7B5|nr:alanine racemase [endosymbiont 'TC1' of Trimyema compressum]AMP21375.1 hypothetical protein AZF37_09620 [endosymbiont 'TC1' of Trimyema compressum]
METPYIYIDYEKLIRNIENMAKICRENKVSLKPHFKSHKTLEIAKEQLKRGSIGITTSTLKETKALVKKGINNITLAYPLVSERKIKQYKKLGKESKLSALVLDYQHGLYLNAYFSKVKPCNVWLKINTGLNRLGIEPHKIPSELEKLKNIENIKVVGFLAHGGNSYSGKESLEKVGTYEGQALVAYKKPPLLVSCGSAPTAKWVSKVKEVDEIRPRNYVFYDRTTVSLGVCQKEECALYVKATVIGKYIDRLVIDSGSKTLGLDKGVHGNSNMEGFGVIMENPDLVITRLSEEHGVIEGKSIENIQIGQILTILPNHACPVVNLHDTLYVFLKPINQQVYSDRKRSLR